jgi:hypothetical protein
MSYSAKENRIIARAIRDWNRQFPGCKIAITWGMASHFREQCADELAQLSNAGGGSIQYSGHDFELYFCRSDTSQKLHYDDSSCMIFHPIKPTIQLSTVEDWKTAALAVQQNFDARMCILDNAVTFVRSARMPINSLSWHVFGCALSDLIDAQKWVLQQLEVLSA